MILHMQKTGRDNGLARGRHEYLDRAIRLDSSKS